MRAVIIGNSATAVGAVESIREHDQKAEVMVISEERGAIYSRPLLSHYLAGEIDHSRLAYRGSDFYSRHDVQPVLGNRVSSIETAEHLVHTDSGQAYSYDKLLISTGGIPIVPPVPGIETAGVCSFTRLDDAQAIIKHIESGSVHDVVVVGGGMIGIKAVDAIMKRGLCVTMVELAPRILSAALDDRASRIMMRLLQDAGVKVLTENTVAEVQSEGGHVSSVKLRDGGTMPCDLLIFGIGVRPNVELAVGAGISTNRGIVVDEYMRTSAVDVYAAGDVAEAYDLVVDMNRTVAIWPNAYRQGAIAGAHMVGVPRPDAGGIAMNTIQVCGVPAMSIGQANVSGDEYEELYEFEEHKNQYKRLVLRGGRLVGAILVGNINRAGIYTGLIRAKIEVDSYRKNLLSEHFGLLSLPDQYRKHVVTGAGIEV